MRHVCVPSYPVTDCLPRALVPHHDDQSHQRVVSQKENEISDLNSELKRASSTVGVIETILGISPRKRKRTAAAEEEDTAQA